MAGVQMKKMLWKERLESLKKEVFLFNKKADGFYKIELDPFLREIHVIKDRRSISGNDEKLEAKAKQIKKEYLKLMEEL